MPVTSDLSAPLLVHTGPGFLRQLCQPQLGNCCAQGRTESGIDVRARHESAPQRRLLSVRIKKFTLHVGLSFKHSYGSASSRYSVCIHQMWQISPLALGHIDKSSPTKSGKVFPPCIFKICLCLYEQPKALKYACQASSRWCNFVMTYHRSCLFPVVAKPSAATN